MIWYALMFNNDRDINFEGERNMTEYLASFINGEAVRQTRDAREKQKIIPDQDFEQILREKFGRDLTPEAIAGATRAETQDAPVPVEVKKKGSISMDDIRKYTGLDMDEVKFIPKK
jgi:hypothetical protein